jgi:hypothetical protein
VKTFEVGKTYSTRSACDYNCIFSFEVIARSEKTVTIRSGGRGTVRRKVRVYDGAEHIDPHGRYSMAPVLSANDDRGAA